MKLLLKGRWSIGPPERAELLMAKNIHYRRTHDLREFIDLISDIGIEFPESLMEIRNLSPFAVEFRYDYIPIEEEEPFDRCKALEIVRKLREWIEKKEVV